MAEDNFKTLNCTNSKLVEVYDVELYVEGNARPSFVVHLETCAFCQAEVEKEVRLDKLLSVKLGQGNRENCLSIEQLQDFTMGWLKGREKSQAKKHLDTCPFCWLELTQLQAEQAIPLSKTEPFVNDNLIRRVIAKLQPRSQTPQLRALRGEEADGGLVYRFEDVTILLSFEPDQTARNRFTMTGTVNLKTYDPTRFTGSKAILKQRDTEVVQEEIETSGDFFLVMALPNYKELKLEIHLADLILEIPELSVS